MNSFYLSICIQKTIQFLIVDSATYIHSSTYGYGSKQIIADTWFVEISNAINYITVSRDGHCVPLTGHNFLSEPRESILLIIILIFHFGIL